ncbi:MAG TPA: hypothetical protein VFE78_23315 [Gemmataceae bacterium]|jgi:hypothetical protein|nr:hypothetical protein [Gemmataceae bacterium]
MGRRRGPRLQKGLPRGGLGQFGWAPALGTPAAAFFLRPDLVALAGVLAFPLCVWCALGLRQDEWAGEGQDHYVDEDSVEWGELLLGNIVHPERRQSTVMIVFCLLGCLVAVCRWWFGWGPVA